MNLKILQHNCLDFFIFLDNEITKPISEYTEEEWQALTYSKRGNKQLSKIIQLAELYKKINPDVIVLNEVGGKESLENFNKYFLDNKYQVALKEGSKRGIDTGFLVKPKLKYKLSGYKTYTIGKKEFYFSRRLNQISILNNESKVILNIFGTHLKSLGGKGNNSDIIETRYNEVKGIIEVMRAQRKESKAPYILAGDLNGNCEFYEHDFEFDLIYKKTSLRDIHFIKKSNINQSYSFVRMYRNITDYKQLDYILLSKELHNKAYAIKRFLFEKNKHVSTWTEKELEPSDHYPQFVKIKL